MLYESVIKSDDEWLGPIIRTKENIKEIIGSGTQEGQQENWEQIQIEQIVLHTTEWKRMVKQRIQENIEKEMMEIGKQFSKMRCHISQDCGRNGS